MKEQSDEATFVVRSGNIFEQPGLPNPAERQHKAQLMLRKLAWVSPTSREAEIVELTPIRNCSSRTPMRSQTCEASLPYNATTFRWLLANRWMSSGSVVRMSVAR